MGQALSKCNSQQKKRTLTKWKGSDWVISLNSTEVRSALCTEKARLSEEVAWLQVEKERLEASALAVKADAMDMERKVHLLESELANEKEKVKGLEKQVLAEKSVNTQPTVSKRGKVGMTAHQDKRSEELKISRRRLQISMTMTLR